MFKVSVVETRNQRQLLLEGKLITPWIDELKAAYCRARVALEGRELVIVVKNLTAISQEGENLLLQLMQANVTVRCCGLFAKEIKRQLNRRMRCTRQEASR